MQHAIALKATLSAEVADKARATRLLKWVLAPWRRLWLGSGPARVSALAEVRQEKRKVGRILLLMEAAGQLPGVRLWAAQRMVATERAGAGWRRSMRWWDGKGQECGSAVWRIAWAVRAAKLSLREVVWREKWARLSRPVAEYHPEMFWRLLRAATPEAMLPGMLAVSEVRAAPHRWGRPAWWR
jgi:hypothetical protein